MSKLNEYFQSKKDKLKLFKLYDTNKDGYLSPEEFITVLNSRSSIKWFSKIQILKIVDKINAFEFLSFINSIRDINKLENDFNSLKKNELSQIQSMSNS